MKLVILQNSDVMEKNGFRIRTQRPQIVRKQVVLFQDKQFVDLCNKEINDFFKNSLFYSLSPGKIDFQAV